MRKNPRMLQAGRLALSIGFLATGCQKTAIDDTDGYIYYDNLSVHKISN